ncbi:predicted protein [Cyanophage PSS2]|uniref:RNA polymerase sigma factor n=1 Tax=Cyanophage PSS2 TaxID=658401 RepID=UPI0001B04048|nr:RNA polymerase sigma factor [Cyanophage PSS2]ACT65675.1 RNAP sigma factor [Cyanophage PSS2]ACY75815.1 predicted protein [Cyanophage PSS2]
MQINDWLANAAQYPITSQEEVIVNARIVKNWKAGLVSERKGQAALQRIVKGNLRLVAAIWKKRYLKRNIAPAHSLEILQEGAIGLNDAAMRFDPSSGYRFSTFASWWIIKSMKEYQRDSERLVRFKGDMHWKALKAVKMLHTEKGQHSTEEIEKALKMPAKRAINLAMTFTQLHPKSLDVPNQLSGNDASPLHEFIADPSTTTFDYEIPNADRIAKYLFDQFDVEPRMRELILNRFEVRGVAKETRNAQLRSTKKDQGQITALLNRITARLQDQGVTLTSLIGA